MNELILKYGISIVSMAAFTAIMRFLLVVFFTDNDVH